MAGSALVDRRLVAGAGLALVLANARYWTSVAPIVRRELKQWRLRAEAIDDPELRELAVAKLDGEGFHAEAAAMLATSAPRKYRDSVVEAIVALELLFDYLDGLTERPSRDPLREGERVFQALIDAVSIPSAVTGLKQPVSNDGGYLEALSRAVCTAVARLPAALAITDLAQRIASRAGEAQVRMHAAGQLGTAQLEEWGRAHAEGTGLGWRELVAGSASSVLALHALIAAAADHRLASEDAVSTAEAYFSTCVLLTLLDGLVDYEQDRSGDGSSTPGYLSLFEDHDQLSEVLAQAARRAVSQARRLPDGSRHVMLLTGVVAYYGSAPGAEGELGRPVIARLRRELAPLIAPTLAVMRTWRIARQRVRLLRAKGKDESYHETPSQTGTVGSPRCCG
jgi:tetraprenyl-beta-curcumene synthase